MSDDPAFAAQRTLAHSKTYRDAVLKLGSEWSGKDLGKVKIGVLDLWDAILKDAGGDGEELRPYFTYVTSANRSSLRMKVR